MKSFQVLTFGRDISYLNSIYAERVGAADGTASREREG